MKIEFAKMHGVISDFTATELPDFAVFIGPNGAGKSHILRALRDGDLNISGINKEGIQLYESHSFQSHSSNNASRQTSKQIRGMIDAFFLQRSDGDTLSNISRNIFDEVVKSIDYSNDQAAFVTELKNEIHRIPPRGVFGLNGNNLYSAKISNQVLHQLSDREFEHRRVTGEHHLNKLSIKDSKYCQLLSAAMRKTEKLPHELSREDIDEVLQYYYEHPVTNRLSEVFSEYKRKRFTWTHRQVELEGAASYTEIIQQFQVDSPPPWQIMREILADMRESAGDYALFDFDFTDPEDQELNMENFEIYTFKAEMTNRTTGATYDLHDLSSGEQILMAMCMVSFNKVIGRHPLQLLLMDEVDAMLHPSMVKALVRTLKKIFVSEGIPVLMASHSPMTIATLDDGEVFKVSRTGRHVEISPITKNDAISELSEGLATVEKGLKIAESEEAKITILTEGNNYKHLNRWAELFFPDDVKVFENLTNRTNKNELVYYGRLLSKINLNSHFVIVWDCDASKEASLLQNELPASSNVTAFAFPEIENSITSKGIENMYGVEILEPYVKEISIRDSRGVTNEVEFDSKRKTEFANYIAESGSKGTFANFTELRKLIDGILQDMDS